MPGCNQRLQDELGREAVSLPSQWTATLGVLLQQWQLSRRRRILIRFYNILH